MKFQREFLNLAAVWLACRLNVMGGDARIGQGARLVVDMHSLGWAMLGCVDYAAEMRMICRGLL